MSVRTLAIYGKGGIGKSFLTTNLTAALAHLNNRVLQIGCDPKHDSTTSLFGGLSLPTVTEAYYQKQQQNSKLGIEDVVFKTHLEGIKNQIFGIELGGPEVGRGCGGRSIISGFDILEELGLFSWNLDYILMDFLGDVVCGGFATPLSRSLCEEVILVVSNDRQSIFAANNICLANNHFNAYGGQSKLLGMIVNRDDGSGVAEKYAEAAGINILMKLPYSSEARSISDSFDVLVRHEKFQDTFLDLASQFMDRSIPYCKPIGLSYEEFMLLFGEVEFRRPQSVELTDLFDKEQNQDASEVGPDGRQQGPDRLDECIAKLPSPEKDILIAHDKKGLSLQDIAAEKKIGLQETEDLLKSARAQLKQLFFSHD
jgi:chlorophyllide a reductase subunit X